MFTGLGSEVRSKSGIYWKDLFEQCHIRNGMSFYVKILISPMTQLPYMLNIHGLLLTKR